VHAQDILTGASQIVVAPNGESVYMLDGATGSIYRASADRQTGTLQSGTKIASVSHAKSLAVKTVRD
jgi:hypothetical protein